MRVIGRVLRCAACSALLVLVWCSAAVAGAGASGSSRGWIGGQPLLVPEVDRLLGGAQSDAAWLAGRAGPGAFAARRASGSSFIGLSPARATGELGRAFPGLVAGPAAAGGAVSLPAGARLLRYRTDGAAEIAVGHRRAIVESVAPLAARIPGGRRAPLDLSLTQTGGQYAPVRSEAHVGMPTTLSRGVSLSEVGVSLTPVDAHGRPLTASAGTLDGGSVVWRDSESGSAGVHDLVTVARPSAVGFDLSSVLLSQRSPGSLYFRVGVPSGARLQAGTDGSVRVVRGGKTLASIPPSTARDAEGSAVPVTTSVRGNTIVLSVGRAPGLNLYPIVVDPEINDTQLATTTSGKRSNWEFYSSNGARFAGSKVYEGVEKEHLETKGVAEYAAGEWAYWGYETKGNSKIYELKTKTSAKNTGSKIESFLEFMAPGAVKESKKVLSTEQTEPEYSGKPAQICAWNASKVEECLPAAGKEKNAAHFQQSATASPGSKYNFSDSMSEGIVSISEPSGTHSTTSYNTGSAELEFEVEVEGKKERVKRKNALYGSGVWLSKYEGALEMIAKDPGIGVAATKLEYESSPNVWTLLSKHEYLEKENSCQGVQCYATHSEDWTLDPKLPDGEQKIRYRAEEAMAGTVSLESEGQATVKVDSSKPHALRINGLPYGSELSERPYELTGEATDGEGTTVASSGIKSIALYIDGRQFGSTGGSCSVIRGECTGSMKWTVNGSELGAGHHKIYLVAFDNAGNEARSYEQISVRHSTPVALGPGSIDLESGDYSLGSGDVSMGSGLTVGRSYSSRNLTQGNEGPLGPQWSINLGSTDSLVEMADGAVLMTAANGSQTIFAPLGEGKFESPPGDSNLEMNLEENKETKQKFAYYLKDSAKATSVKFTLPSGGTKVWVPTNQEGTVATDTVTYAYQTASQHNEYKLPSSSRPYGIAKGPDGEMWFADQDTNKIGKITTSGTTAEYALPLGSEPIGITAGPDKNLWFTDTGTSKIGKITTAGVISEYALPTGSKPWEIASGPDGNLWFTNGGTDKIGKITTAGVISEYALPSGSKPRGIVTGPDGNLWFTNGGTDKIGKITTAGAISEYALPSGSKPMGMASGPDNNLWFTDLNSSKIGKITTSGTITEYSLPSGSKPRGIVAGPDKNLWFTAGYETSKIGKVTTEGAINEYLLGSNSEPAGIAVGPDENLWFARYTSDSIGTMTTSGTVTEPTEALAPKPAGVSCVPELKVGCRSLKFKYATSTTAKGDAQSEWGEFEGRLKTVLLDAYNPSTKAMQETAVAEYSYDGRGRLRAEWDPRISPALKTLYGYDQEGHVTALTAPGHETWAFVYGTIPGDVGTGRLLRMAQAPASAPLWSGSLPINTVVPALTPVEPTLGASVSASSGTWSGNPVAYRYQWQRCNAAGGECVAIVGADNETYKPTLVDPGHALRVEVQATNGGGSAVAYSAAAKVVAVRPVYSSQFGSAGTGNGQFKSPHGVAVDGSGNVWVVDTANNRVQEFSSSGSYVRQFGSLGTGNGQFKEPVGVAITSEGNVWVTDCGNNRVQEFSSEGVYMKQFGSEGTSEGQFVCPAGITVTPEGNLWVADSNFYRVEEFTSTGTFVRWVGESGTGNGQFASPDGVASDAYGDIWVTDYGNNRVQELSSTGQYIRQMGSLGTGNGQFKGPQGVAVDSTGEVWVADNGNNRIQGFNPQGAYLTQYGSTGSGNGQFSEPWGIVVTGAGKVYVADLANNRVQALTPTTSTLAFKSKFGSNGSEPGQMSWPQDAVLDSSGNVWIADAVNNRVEEFTAGGSFIKQFGTAGSGNGQFKTPEGLAFTAEGNIWVTDKENYRVQEFDQNGNYITQFGSHGSGNGQFNGPHGVVIAPGTGDIWISDREWNNRVEEFTPAGAFIRQIAAGSGNGQLNSPENMAIDAEGHLWVADTGNNRVQEFSSTGEYIRKFGSAGGGRGQFNKPASVTLDSYGEVWVADASNNRIQGFNATGEFLTEVGGYGSGNGQFYDPTAIAVTSAGTYYVVDSGWGRVQSFALPDSTSEAATPPRTEGAALTTVAYGVSLSGGSGLPNMSSSEVAKWGQKDVPAEATAIFPPDAPQGWPAANYQRATVYYLDEEGRMVNVSSPSMSSYGSVSTTEYDEETHDVVRTLSADNRVTALKAGSKSVEVSKLLDTQYTYNSPECRKETPAKEKETAAFGTRLCETWGPQHTVKYMAGKEQRESLARNHMKYFYEDTAHGAPAGETYNLVTETSDLALLANEEEVEVRKTATSYSGQSNLGWKLRAPTSVTEDPEGKKITRTTLYNSATGQVIETRGPGGLNGESAHDARLIYYSAEANTEGFASCGLHPEWAGLVCETLPAKQPNTVGVPNLPVTTMTYNMFNEPTAVTETFGSVTRTKKEIYDAAGRLTASKTNSTEDVTLPVVEETYNAETGVLEKHSTIVEGKTQTLTSKYDTLGRMVEYVDADGNIAKYRYGGPENDGLIEEMTDGAAGGTAKQTYGYSSATKQLEELTDSAAGRFTASYDAEGKLTSEVYPNGMCANTSYNSVGEATHIEYIKTTVCSEKPTPWFSETRTPSVRGETFARSSTLASETYGYDALGRLTETQETPAGEGCSERIYAYDEESNRTSLTKRTPGTGGVCATEGGTVEAHTYDEGNRMTDTGIEYDGFGNIKKLPAADAEGHELTSTYYVDNAVASQSQNGVSHEYKLDPAGRARETLGGTTPLITHYDGSGEAVAWTSESTEKWTRNIPGIDGTLSAVQTNGGTPVLQLHDLQGNITATAELSKESTKLLSTYNSTEFGVPNKEKVPPKYAWLGAGGVESAFSSGVVTYGSTSYVPQTGRALQSEQVEPPGLPGGSGAGTPYVSQEEPWNMQGAAAGAAEAPGENAGAEDTGMEEAAANASEAASASSILDEKQPPRYMWQKEALYYAKKFTNLRTWSEVFDAITAFLGIADPPAALFGAVVSAITLGEMQDWLHNAAFKMRACGKIREHNFHISGPWMCKATYWTMFWKKFINPTDLMEMEKCNSYGWYKNGVFWESLWECRRLGQKLGPE